MKLLKIGSEGPDVELLQSTLKKIGYYKHNVDGIFEIQTFNSVINFQKSRTLSPDGIVGNKTWNALEPYINGFYTYTIKEGDTFFSLAEANNITVNSLISANPNVNYNNLQIGQKIIIPFNNIVYTDISYTSDILQRNITSLKKIYPFLTVANIGYSNLGTPIQCIRFGKGRKQVFYSSSIHANEWITTPILMKFLEDLCYKYVNNIPFENKNVTELFNSTLLYIVPMINPDGVDLVTGNLNKNSNAYINAQNIAKNFPELKFPSDWKANIAGVDLNLQFPAGWAEARRIKYAEGFNKPAPRDFVGYSPLSTPEARAIYNFVLTHNFSLLITYHTQGEVIFYQYQNYAPERSLEIANAFAESSGYSVEDVPYNSSFAGLKDWFIYYYRKPGFTIEAGLGVNPLPISQFNEIYNDNIGILVLGMTK